MSSGKKTAIAIGVLVAVAVGAVIALIQLNGSSDGDRAGQGPQSTVAAPSTQPPPTTGAPINYVVRRGDTLTSIAEQFGVLPAAIVAANQLTNPDQLTEGATLVIPPAPPLQLVIRPARTTAGDSVELTLTGAKPAESVTFEVNSPTGTFTGSPHTASSDGTVMTTYTPDLGAPEGIYTVIAKGDQGTTAQASLQVEPPDF
ncbi:MAG: LysM peptidoglycan-binding domain-containing protein [Actinobacteria bacterium]|nr:LysM peptidoglycan-binding domain-containing protein [Actinomycetota bacterium]